MTFYEHAATESDKEQEVISQGYPMTVSWITVPYGAVVEGVTEEQMRDIAELASCSDSDINSMVETAHIIGWRLQPDGSAPVPITTRGEIQSGGTPPVVVSYDQCGREYFLKWMREARATARKKVDHGVTANDASRPPIPRQEDRNDAKANHWR